MKKRKLDWKQAAPLIGLAVLMLYIVTALSTPLAVGRALAKYGAQAQGTASARVAKWAISLNSKVPTDNQGAIKFCSGYTDETIISVVTITNQSEVAMIPDASIVVDEYVGGVNSGNLTRTLTRTGGTGAVAPGGAATYNLTVSTSASTDGYAKLHIECSAVQVD